MKISEYAKIIWALCVWREARGETLAGKYAVAWTIRNRAERPGWWGTDIVSVVLKPWQFSSFNPGDPNAIKWPQENDTTWLASIDAVEQAADDHSEDPVKGATHYFDASLDSNPPAWSKSPASRYITSIGRLRFYVA